MTGYGDETGVNPKDLIGVKKVAMHLFPPVAKIHACLALMNGAEKYGAYNWRDYKVQVTIYLDAIERHLDAYKDGEDYAEDSGLHHLAHLLAGAAILMDAIECGMVVDNRPKPGIAGSMIEDLAAKVDPPEDGGHNWRRASDTVAGSEFD